MDEEILDDLFIENEGKSFNNKLTSGLLRFFILLQIGVAIYSTIYAWIYVESILDSVQIGIPIGILVLIGGLWLKNKPSIFIGISAPLISLSCLALVWGLGWSSGEARIPIPSILTIYSLGLIIYALPLFFPKKNI